jgi:hypothetical protein
MTEGIWLGRGSAVSKLGFGDGGRRAADRSQARRNCRRKTRPHIVKPRETLFKFP